jgi:hypothetical protein
VARTWCDEWGAFSALVPSTFIVNLPTPSGLSPSMLEVTVNDPGPVRDPADPSRSPPDPWFRPDHEQVRGLRPFLPGRTTSLLVPLGPLEAKASKGIR